MITEHILSGSDALDADDGFTIDRSKYLNASSATTCIRKQWFERHRPPVEQSWGYARRGKQGELYLVDCLAASGVTMARCGADQVSIVSEAHRISATPDGFARLGGEWRGLEFKTIDPRTNRKNLPKPEHVTQLQISMELAHLQDAACPKPASGILLYMDASNYDDLIEIPVARDPGVLDALAERAKRMLNAKGVTRLDREGKRDGQCARYGGCPFAAECGVEIAGEAKVARANRGSALDAAVAEYVLAKGDEAHAAGRKKVAAESIKAEMTARNASDLSVGNHRVSMQQIAGRRAYDWKAMQEDGLDLSPYMTTGKPSERLTVE